MTIRRRLQEAGFHVTCAPINVLGCQALLTDLLTARRPWAMESDPSRAVEDRQRERSTADNGRLVRNYTMITKFSGPRRAIELPYFPSITNVFVNVPITRCASAE